MAQRLTPAVKRDLRKALFAAISDDDVASVRRLIAEGADPDAVDRSDGYTPLNLAIEKRHLEIARVLLNVGAAPGKGIVDNLEEAIDDKNVELVKLLLAHGADPDGGGPKQMRVTRPLMEAARVGSAKIVDLLLLAGADRTLHNEVLRTAADIAAESGFPRIATKLRPPTEKKPGGRRPLSKEDVKAMRRAIERGSVPAVTRIAKGKVLDQHFAELQATPLILAVWCENWDVVQALIDAGASVSFEAAELPLEVAAKGDRIAVMECLVAAGADVNGESTGGTTALITAMRQERTVAVRWLLQHGADAKAKNRFNRTVSQEMSNWEASTGRTNECRGLL